MAAGAAGAGGGGGGSGAFDLVRQLLQGGVHRFDGAGELFVARFRPVVHRHQIAMHGIEPFGGVAAQLHLFGDAAGGLLGGLARHFVLTRRGIHPLDQLEQGALDFADLGELRLGAGKLLGHL